MKLAPSSSLPSKSLSHALTRNPQDWRPEVDARLRARRNRLNDRDSIWRIMFIVVACRLVHKPRDTPPRLRNQPMAIAPKKNKTTVITPNTLKLHMRKIRIVTHSTVRAQLPAIRRTLGEFGLPEKRCVGSQKRSEEHTSELQSRRDLVCR